MHAIVRSYEGIDQSKTDEFARQVDESLLSRLNKLPGFSGYFLIDAGSGVMTSVGLFDTSAQADESTRVVANWLRDEKLDATLPNTPKIATGNVRRVQGVSSRTVLRGTRRPAPPGLLSFRLSEALAARLSLGERV
jgi:hypothetical protein